MLIISLEMALNHQVLIISLEMALNHQVLIISLEMALNHQLLISDLYIFTFTFRYSYFETTFCLHIFGSLSRSRTVLSYHLQDFIMQFLFLQFYNLIYVRLQNFISPLSGQPSSSSIFGQAARSMGGQWLLPWASAVWPRQS